MKLDVSVNGDPVDALSFILHKDNAYFVGKELCNKLKEIIPRQQFKVPIQAKIGEKIIASAQVTQTLPSPSLPHSLTHSLSPSLPLSLSPSLPLSLSPSPSLALSPSRARVLA